VQSSASRIRSSVRRWLLQILITLAAFIADVTSAATIEGNSLLLSSGDAQQIETWLGEGPLTFTNIFTSLLGTVKNANDFHQFRWMGLGPVTSC
jgi:hypothetical protein